MFNNQTRPATRDIENHASVTITGYGRAGYRVWSQNLASYCMVWNNLDGHTVCRTHSSMPISILPLKLAMAISTKGYRVLVPVSLCGHGPEVLKAYDDVELAVDMGILKFIHVHGDGCVQRFGPPQMCWGLTRGKMDSTIVLHCLERKRKEKAQLALRGRQHISQPHGHRH